MNFCCLLQWRIHRENVLTRVDHQGYKDQGNKRCLSGHARQWRDLANFGVAQETYNSTCSMDRQITTTFVVKSVKRKKNRILMPHDPPMPAFLLWVNR